MPTLLLAAVATILTQTAPAPEITVEPLAEGGYRLTVIVEGASDPARAQTLLNPKAAALCGAQPVRFGRYQFRSVAPGDATASAGPEKVMLVQEVSCGAAPAPTAPAGPAAILSDAEMQAINPHILKLTDAYFAATDDGRDAEAFAMTSEEMHGGVTLAEWSERERERRERAGATISRQVAKLTWYQNPSSAEPGHYVAADYVADREREDECGYLVWFRPDASTSFILVRQEITHLPDDLDPTALAALRQRHCILL